MSNLKSTYWTENDLKEAIDNLQNLRLTPEEHTAYVMTLSYNAIGIQMAKQEREAFAKEAVKQAMIEITEKVKKETIERVEKETTEKMARISVLAALKKGKLSDLEIVEYFNVSIEYVLSLKKELNL